MIYFNNKSLLYQNFLQYIRFQFVFHQSAIKTFRAFKNFTRIFNKIWPHNAAPPKFDIFLLNERDIPKMHSLRAAQITHFLGRAPKICIGTCCRLGKSIESHNSFFPNLPCRSLGTVRVSNSLPKLISIEISISICGAMQIQWIDLVLYASPSVSLSTPRSICPFGALTLVDYRTTLWTVWQFYYPMKKRKKQNLHVTLFGWRICTHTHTHDPHAFHCQICTWDCLEYTFPLRRQFICLRVGPITQQICLYTYRDLSI